MKKLYCVLAAFTLVLSPATAFGQAAALPDADPALWVVRDEDTTIYLFGTFHMLDGRPWFNDEVRTAFEASQELVLEAVMPEGQSEVAAMAARRALDPQGRRLSQRLTAEENARLVAMLNDHGLPAAIFDRLEPWFVALTLTVTAVQRAGLAGTNGAETVLSAAARRRNMPIGQLESIEFQMQLLDSIPDDLQLLQLRATLNELPRLREILPPALAAWSSGDMAALDRALDDPASSNPRLRQIMMTDRNLTWTRRIRERLARPGTVFIAVGAGHLAGADSVQTLLGREGLRVERVPHRGAP